MGFIRTILAITVVCAHSPWHEVGVGARNAVQLFYMISGFLISYILTTNSAYKDTIKFYLNRALRIYPIYYAVALLALAAHLLAHPKFFLIYQSGPAAASILLVLSNILLFGQDWVMFSGVTNGQFVFAANYEQSDLLLYEALLVPQAWTLGLELSFYALAPFILQSKRTIFSLIVVSLIVRGILMVVGIGMNDPWTYRFFPAELSLFLFGALSNQYLLPLWNRYILQYNRERIIVGVTWLVIFFFLGYSLIPIAGTIKTFILFLVFFVLLPVTFIYQGTSRLDKLVGELSYPIYIGHLLVVMVLRKIWDPNTNDIIVSVSNVLGAIVFAYILNKYIGRPVENLRMKVKSRCSSSLINKKRWSF